MLFLQLPFSVLADVSTYLENIQYNPNALYAFFKAMPKGGELHYHLTGGAYPEVMLDVAAQEDYCLEPDSWHIEKTAGKCKGIDSKVLAHDFKLYNQALRAWSMKDFHVDDHETSEDHFFAAFSKFYAVADDHYPLLLADVMDRAARQGEHYLEVMAVPSVQGLNQLPHENHALTRDNFHERHQQLLTNPVFQRAVHETIKKLDDNLKAARKKLGCDERPQSRVCQLTIKYQYYALRGEPLETVFEQALLGFIVAQKSPNVVGVNLVQREDGMVALRDYQQHMQIFQFLHHIYPNVAIDLHAGELNPQSVMPKETRFHIRDAVYVGHAKRIGHGVDIAHETNPEGILRDMKQKGIAVEINLTSNAMLLNIQGKQHPLNYYLAHQVPVVLSTDDEGLLRTDLTSQYVTAVFEHGLDYPTIKQINRNALSYSFLPGKSLWRDLSQAVPVIACKDLASNDCLQFVKHNEKAQVQRELEIELKRFERQYE